MNIVSQPLFYLANGFAGMFLYVWLLDRAYKIYMPDSGEKRQEAPKFTRTPFNVIGVLRVISGLIVTVILWLALYKTSLNIADLVLVTMFLSFAVSSYRIRLRPLLASGLALPHLASLIFALGLWFVPILWFFHLHLVGSYSAA